MLRTVLKWLGRLVVLLVIAAIGAWFVLRLPPGPDLSAAAQINVSHRGESSQAPENTLYAIRLAQQLGAQAVELDVGVSVDGTYLLMHDCSVNRTADGRGRVSEMTLADLQALTVLPLNGPPGDYRIPTLDEALDVVAEVGLMAELDVKEDVAGTAFGTWLGPALAAPGLDGQVWVASFYPDKLYAMRRAAPSIATAFLRHPLPTENALINRLIGSDLIPMFLGVSMLRPHFDIVTPEFQSRWQERGMPIVTWVMNTYDERAWAVERGLAYSTDCILGTCPPFVIGEAAAESCAAQLAAE